MSDVKQGWKQVFCCSAVKGKEGEERGGGGGRLLGSCDGGLKELSRGQHMASQAESSLLLKKRLLKTFLWEDLCGTKPGWVLMPV